ncbi:MAG: type II toxin-antitoxin system HipA family toxin, partial [Bacteroidales bacterium]|nr:type II toxin-antitoxin system HipA family toxin [Bacteroidales bacterium]
NNLTVGLDFGDINYNVGELVRKERHIYFRYYPEFLDKKLEISPIKLPLNNELHTTSLEPFEGLFGVFNDSLPDGWGRLLLDRSLLSLEINLNEITPLDRLSYVGLKGHGALTYQPKYEIENKNTIIDLDVISKESMRILQGHESEILDELYQLGGSSGGARPKIFVSYKPSTNQITNNTSILPDEYEEWLIKFPSSSDPVDISNIEFAYYKMAIDAGLTMSECKLISGNSGKSYFATKRFDRENGKKFHMHSASGIMHDNFRLSNMDYGHLMDCAFQLEKHAGAYENILRLAAFNIFTHNRDDHSKNFSFLMDAEGNWKFAPVYDLTFSYSSHGHHSTMVAGESKNPGRKHLYKLAEHFSIKNASKIIDEVLEVVTNWKKYAKNCDVRYDSAIRIDKVIQKLIT